MSQEQKNNVLLLVLKIIDKVIDFVIGFMEGKQVAQCVFTDIA